MTRPQTVGLLFTVTRESRILESVQETEDRTKGDTFYPCYRVGTPYHDTPLDTYSYRTSLSKTSCVIRKPQRQYEGVPNLTTPLNILSNGDVSVRLLLSFTGSKDVETLSSDPGRPFRNPT